MHPLGTLTDSLGDTQTNLSLSCMHRYRKTRLWLMAERQVRHESCRRGTVKKKGCQVGVRTHAPVWESELKSDALDRSANLTTPSAAVRFGTATCDATRRNKNTRVQRDTGFFIICIHPVAELNDCNFWPNRVSVYS